MRIAPSLLVEFGIVVALIGCSTTDLAEGVTQRTVKSLKIGMPVDSVLMIIGLPFYARYGTGIHDSYSCRATIPIQKFVPNDGPSIVAAVDSAFYSSRYCCNTERERRTRRFTLEYSRKPAGPGSYPMLWVSFNDDHRVRSVFAKVYYQFPTPHEDMTLYLLSAGDSIRSSQAGGDQQLFERFFPD